MLTETAITLAGYAFKTPPLCQKFLYCHNSFHSSSLTFTPYKNIFWLILFQTLSEQCAQDDSSNCYVLTLSPSQSTSRYTKDGLSRRRLDISSKYLFSFLSNHLSISQNKLPPHSAYSSSYQPRVSKLGDRTATCCQKRQIHLPLLYLKRS